MTKAMRGGFGPGLLLGTVTAIASAAIVYVHYDQKQQRVEMRKSILMEVSEERRRAQQELLKRQQEAVPGSRGEQ